MTRIRTAIHLHTHCSYDSNLAPAALVEAAGRMGVACVAITDHNTIDGAREAQALGKIRVIVGEEISSVDGHLLGLFLRERIPPGLSAEQTIAEIHGQGGVALAPHPFCTLCSNSLQQAVWRLVELLDGVEVFNAQNPIPAQDRRAADFARQTGLTRYAGMDAHVRPLPATFQIMPDFQDAGTFLQALAQAELQTARAGWRYYAMMGVRHFWDLVFPRPLPTFGAGTPQDATVADESAERPVVQPTRIS